MKRGDSNSVKRCCRSPGGKAIEEEEKREEAQVNEAEVSGDEE